MKVLDILSSEDAWVKGIVAVDESGKQVYACSSLAVRWCIVGAIERVVGTDAPAYPGIMRKISDSVAKLFPQFQKDLLYEGLNAIKFNNHRDTKYQDLRAVLEDAGV